MKTMTSRDDRATITAMMGVSSDCVFWSVPSSPRPVVVSLVVSGDVASTVGSMVVSSEGSV